MNNFKKFLKFFKNKKAFTLIEALLVISIIGILSGIFVMSVIAYLDNARVAKAMNFASSIERAMAVNSKGKWNFNDAESGKIKDFSGQENEGVVFGTETTDDTPQKIIGSGSGEKALVFSSSDDYVDFGISPDLKPSGEMTVSLWFKVFDYPSGNAIMQGDYSTDFKGYAIGIGNDGNLFFWLSVNDPAQRIALTSYPNPVSKNKWHHAVFTFNGTKAKLYLDAKKIKEYSFASVVSISVSSGPNYLGKGSFSPSNFNGIIKDSQIYNKGF